MSAVFERAEIELGGVVQGVGLRPWAARRARALGLAGEIRNRRAGVVVVLEGPRAAIDAWLDALHTDPPVGARIEACSVGRGVARGRRGFAIEASRASLASGTGRASPRLRIPPDVASCSACVDELFDPRQRRYRYAFTHCATCGPRASVLRALPFDRARTTLADFAPCEACSREYSDPADRRYHAQTLACATCGPQLTACAGSGRELAGDPVERAARELVRGGIVALKGHGGFHLAVDATRAEAVARLRKRKGRATRPFALLVADVASARALATLGERGEALLCGPARPVVLAARRAAGERRIGLAEGVAPNVPDLGLLLPYAPLHWLLLYAPGERPGRDAPRFPALILTSANRSGEPTLHSDREARARLASLADLVLGHDRVVERPNDDSVYRVSSTGPIPIRLSRATAPMVLPLPCGLRATEPIVALGGDLKCAPALVTGEEILLAEHVGDLEHVDTADALALRIRVLCQLVGVEPRIAVHDLHPDSVAATLAARLAPVQHAAPHHRAHAMACLVEHGEIGPALAWVLDGAGHGTDASVWGGELLFVDGPRWQRRAHLERVALPGGDAAAREPWRMAAVWLARAFPDGAPALAWQRRHAAGSVARLLRVAERGVQSPPTSSAGRLFDAAASLLDRCDRASHEGEAASALEALAMQAHGAYRARACAVAPIRARERTPRSVPVAGLIRDLACGLAAGRAPAGLARAFHADLAERLAAEAAVHASALGVSRVALSGGCFQNRLLLEDLSGALEQRGLEVRRHGRVPPNDGGLAVGQAVIALLSTQGEARG